MPLIATHCSCCAVIDLFQVYEHISNMCSHVSNEENHRILRLAQSGDVTVLAPFISANPQVHLCDLSYATTGDSILHAAARLGHIQVINFLLDCGHSDCVNVKNNDNKTPLHEACQFAQFDVARILIERGADVNTLKKSDWTALMLACTKVKSEEENLKIVTLLVDNGALINYRNKDGWSALHLLCREPAQNVLKYLIEQGLHLDTVTKNGRTALHVACLHANLDVITILLQNAANVNQKDNSGSTPLHEAVTAGNLNVLELLLENGADVEVRNAADITALHLAASFCEPLVVGYIINSCKISPHVSNIIGLTPLHCAAKNNNRRSYEFLKMIGVKENVKDRFGRYPYEYFSSKNLNLIN